MTIRIHNTLTRTKEELRPLVDGQVGLYVCGPTVYDDCHIGHLMGPVLFDSIARWLAGRGFQVRFVNNITDIDDKIIQRALAEGVAWDTIAGRYTQAYFDLMRELDVITITDHPRCSEFIPQMIAYIEDLMATDRAYQVDDGVYYDVAAQADYGKLSGRRVEEMQAGARIEVNRQLRQPADFALWKKAKPGEPSWPSPFGAGRPGWHLECSVMASRLLGPRFDIHGGGDDLKFPHHENEIAQSEAHGDRFAQIWMHHGLITYGGSKIAKSDPRMRQADFASQFKARTLLDTYGPATLRFFLLRGHYRRPIDFLPDNLAAARTALQRLHRQLGALLDEPGLAPLGEVLARQVPAAAAVARAAFGAAMDDDFGTGEALARLFDLAHLARSLQGEEQTSCLRLLRDLGRHLGLFAPGDGRSTSSVMADDQVTNALMQLILELRQTARGNRDFATADKIRDRLLATGIEIHDDKEGSTWSRQ